MDTSFIVFVIFAYTHLANGDIDCDKSSKHVHYRLKSDLLCDYDRTIRPISNHQNSTTVSVKMILKTFTYDMHSNALNVHCWLALFWQDDHLVWKPENYENVGLMHLNMLEIWTPDFSIYNGYDQSVSQNVLNVVDCIVTSKGRVACIPPASHNALCMANLKKYPYDVQNCTLRFGSWVHSGEEIDFRFNRNPVSLEDYTPNAEWLLLNVTTERHSGHFNCCPNNTYPSISYNFVIQRQASFHGATLIVPAIVTALLTISTFFFDPMDISRLSLSCCSFIVHILILKDMTWQLPAIGDNPPIIILFARDSLMLCLFSILLTIIQKRIISAQNDSPTIISNIISSIMRSRPGQFILLFDFNMKGMANAKCEEDGVSIIDNSSNNIAGDCVLFAKILDKLFFLSYVIAYFCMFIAFIP